MTLETGLALVLAAAVVVAWTGLLLRHRRAPGPGGRLALLMLLQPACAALLYLTLLPPALPTRPGTMTVLTAGASAELVATAASGELLVALPEAPELAAAVRVPDLATALRRHPGASRLEVIGHGLDPRDREAARGHALAFTPPPLPRGLARLHVQHHVAPGAAFPVTGRANALEDGRVRLLDPAGQMVDAAALDGEGGFHLTGHARAAGPVTFTLQVVDAEGGEVETAAVPLYVADAPAPRVLLLAGAPNPEFRHLRRWAEDAGLDLHVEVMVGAGVGLGDGPAPADAGDMGRFDLVILDDRALGSLGASRRAALAQALEAGTGVLLRVTGELPVSVRRHMADLGLAVGEEAGTEAVVLPHVEDAMQLRARLGPGTADAPFDPALAGEAPPELLRRVLRPQAGDVVPLASGQAGEAFAWARAQGKGRIGLWTLADSYRLALGGRGDLHAGLWSAAAGALARPPGAASPRFEAAPRAGRRTAICGLEAGQAIVLGPDGREVAVLVDPASGVHGDPDPEQGTRGCAGYWPESGGWHLLRTEGEGWPFHVGTADGMPAAAAAALQEGTARLAGPGRADGGAAAATTAAVPPRRGASWPWFLAWLAMAGFTWWLERRRPKSE